MPEPTGFKRKVFKSTNSFNPYAGGKVPPGQKAGSRGYCFAMTCRWIKLSMQHGIEGSARVLDGRELLHISIVQASYASCFPGGNSGATTRAAQEKLVYEQSGLRHVSSRSTSEMMSSDGPFELPCYYEIGLPEHSTGMHVSMATDQFFYFDPNYGLYEYTLDAMPHCLKHLATYLANAQDLMNVEWNQCVSK